MVEAPDKTATAVILIISVVLFGVLEVAWTGESE